jgi:hypothetical protein
MTTNVTFSKENRQETVIYSRKDGKFYAARQGEPSVYEISPHEPDNLLAKIKELTEEPAPEAPVPSASPAPATQ